MPDDIERKYIFKREFALAEFSSSAKKDYFSRCSVIPKDYFVIIKYSDKISEELLTMRINGKQIYGILYHPKQFLLKM